MLKFLDYLSEVSLLAPRNMMIITPDMLRDRMSSSEVKKIKELLRNKKKHQYIFYNIETTEIVGPESLPNINKLKPEILNLKGFQNKWSRVQQRM
jgi:hypothetical protein